MDYKARRIGLSLTLALAWAGWAPAATVTVEGRLSRVEAERIFLATDKGEQEFRFGPKSRAWAGRREVKPAELRVGVVLRIKAIEGPAPREIREIVDGASAEWLDRLRKSALTGKVVSIDEKTVTVDFGNDTLFRYRHSAKSRWEIGGKAVVPAGLAPGTTLFFRGRLLPSYDTWLVSATDTEPAASPSKSRSTSAPKPKPNPKPSPAASSELPATGRFDAVVEAWIPSLRFLDVFRNGMRTHVVITPQTVFMVDGVRGDVRSAERGLKCRIHYRRDPYGRILAVRVDLEAVDGR